MGAGEAPSTPQVKTKRRRKPENGSQSKAGVPSPSQDLEGGGAAPAVGSSSATSVAASSGTIAETGAKGASDGKTPPVKKAARSEPAQAPQSVSRVGFEGRHRSAPKPVAKPRFTEAALGLALPVSDPYPPRPASPIQTLGPPVPISTSVPPQATQAAAPAIVLRTGSTTGGAFTFGATEVQGAEEEEEVRMQSGNACRLGLMGRFHARGLQG